MNSLQRPQLNVTGLSKSLIAYKVYQTMFRVVKESETVDARQHCFLLQSSGHDPRYLSLETRQELLRIENSWNAAIITSVIKLGVSRQHSFDTRNPLTTPAFRCSAKRLRCRITAKAAA